MTLRLEVTYQRHGRVRTLAKVELVEAEEDEHGTMEHARIEIPTAILRRVCDAKEGAPERVELMFMPLVSEVELP